MAISRSLPITALALFSGLAFAHAQGSLTPPPGPPTPGMVSLQELWDKMELLEGELETLRGDSRIPIDAAVSNGVVISEPGSYYLVRPILHSAAAVPAIHITASGVTLDMNGCQVSYSQLAAGGAPSDAPGIEIADNVSRVRIENGTLVGFAQGISGLSAKDCRLRRISLAFCDGGISVGEAAKVIDCSIEPGTQSSGSFWGIVTGHNSQIIRCSVSSVEANGQFIGIYAGRRCIVDACQITSNTGTSTTGIRISESGMINRCIASHNEATAGDSIGIESTGAERSPQTQIIDCEASRNGSEGGFGIGISASSSALIRTCTADDNDHTGIKVDAKATVNCCSLYGNRSEGILADERNIIIHNTVNGNIFQGDGIATTGNANTIDSNTITDVGTGILCDGEDNVVTRNILVDASPTLDFDMTQNLYGPIVRITQAGSQELVPANDPDAENPWANIRR